MVSISCVHVLVVLVFYLNYSALPGYLSEELGASTSLLS